MENALDGRAVAPGFIDVHTHDDSVLLSPNGMEPKISQGVTRVIAGNCGISLVPLRMTATPPPPFTLIGNREAFAFDSFADYITALGTRGIATSAALLPGHTTLRQRHVADTQRPANEAELSRMLANLEQPSPKELSG
ncbi:MAG: amidohydrolase family protein [Gemmobacter sp.]|jgi:N-acyl-D-amino-acid deacylase|nr:amidohydrolase family protein [Gemmobacter sp.]